MRGVMFQGTASDVGKSLIATAFCRLLVQKGFKPAPFKSQNVSNNSYVTADGKEIGRAQGLQAEACGLEALPVMNPILLKPSGSGQSEVVLMGERQDTISGMAYRDRYYESAIEWIGASLEQLSRIADTIIIEGAGSPVEMNLKQKEVVNMKVAELADVPVILVADIHRGGLFASVVGTLELLEAQERERVKGIIVNKFRGDPALFKEGVQWLEKRTGIPVLAVLPYIDHQLEGEDSLSLAERFSSYEKKDIDIAAIKLPYLSNYSDMEPFLAEKDTAVRWVERAEELGCPDAVVLPGTKSTFHDLRFLKTSGLAERIIQYVEQGGTIAGLCGGYQLLGRTLTDPHGYDSGTANSSAKGLGLIPGDTCFFDKKTTKRLAGRLAEQPEIYLNGYEIHIGQTKLEESSPFIRKEDGGEEGYYARNGRVIGTYMHHLFHNDAWRSEWLNRMRRKKGLPLRQVNRLEQKQKVFDQLAGHLERYLDWKQFLKILRMSERKTGQ
ncbi:cobyric acid synthase [Bacillus xiapuensis]|uniref:cobyric acid synthase n=1 Tax=Bacillus xiapuensis TaxID=2014075 RepID=UPI000C23025A|nr:cobyric acid synthase [Bacillus xiapuensis]